jgi:hypothetical protein
MKSLRLSLLLGLALIAMACGEGSAFATTIEVGGVAQNKSVTATGSLEAGTSLILKDSSGTTSDTCTESQLKGTTEGTFSGSSVGGSVSTMTFGSCTHTTKVITAGGISIAWTSGTNGAASSTSSEVTVVSTAFGVSTICKTGAGTLIGTITGVKEGNATLDVNAKVNCGMLGYGTVTGSYTGTGKGGLGVTS